MEGRSDSDQENEASTPFPWIVRVESLRRPPLRWDSQATETLHTMMKEASEEATGSSTQGSLTPSQVLEKAKPMEMDISEKSAENSSETFPMQFHLNEISQGPEKPSSQTQNLNMGPEEETVAQMLEEFIDDTIVQANVASTSFALPNHPPVTQTNSGPQRSLQEQSPSEEVRRSCRQLIRRPLEEKDSHAHPKTLNRNPVKKANDAASSSDATPERTRQTGATLQNTIDTGLTTRAKTRNGSGNQLANGNRRYLLRHRKPAVKREKRAKKQPVLRQRRYSLRLLQSHIKRRDCAKKTQYD